ncbi:tRNA 2-thiocytidine(32) synthetase TtcA [bacterium]|nr:tRNA 2-thiocytidine(32) synthetase TtcA [bacterium]
MSLVAYKIRRKVVNALSNYQMINEDDNILVAVSGGADSTVLLKTLMDIKHKARFRFELTAVFVDQNFPEFSIKPFQLWLENQSIGLKIVKFDTFSLIRDKDFKKDSPCAICSRLRRGILYSYAKNNGFNKIALGHNRDDLNETLLMNMLFSGRLSGMPPKFRTKDGYNTIIRPLCYVAKKAISERIQELKAPIIKSEFCDKRQDNTRQFIRNLLQELENHNPKIADSLLASQKNIHPSQFLDKHYWKPDLF